MSTNTYVDKPTVGDRIKAAFSDKTAEEIHAEKLARRGGGIDNTYNNNGGYVTGQPYTNTGSGGSTTNTSGVYPGGNHNSAGYDASSRPSIGDDLHGAVSNRTAQQIHENNRVKDVRGQQWQNQQGIGGGMATSSGGSSSMINNPNNYNTTTSGTGMHNSAAYDATARPTVGDKLTACFSTKTAQEIHEENRAKDIPINNPGAYNNTYGSDYNNAGHTGIGYDNVARPVDNTRGSGWHEGGNYNSASYDATHQPTVGDKVTSCFSTRTAQQIHEDNRAKDLGGNTMTSGGGGAYNNNNTYGTGGTYNNNTSDGRGMYPSGNHNSAGYDASSRPSIGDDLHGAVSNRTAQQIHEDNRAKDLRGGDYNNNYGVNTAAGLATTGHHKHHHHRGEGIIDRNNTTGGYDNINDQPTVGEKLHAAVSTRTAQEIHEDNRAKQLNNNNNYDNNTRDQYYDPQTDNRTRTQGTYDDSNRALGVAPSGTQTRQEMNVSSVTQDALRQVDAQAREALQKCEALRMADEQRLTQSQSGALTQLEQQAAELKAKIDAEKIAAQAEIDRQNQERLGRTRERSEMEKAAINHAAMQRKAQLEAKSNKLQSELDELMRIKTQEMMTEKPGDLQFTHVSEDSGLMAHLTGEVAHKLQLDRDTRTTNSITHGQVQHQPVQVTNQYQAGPTNTNTNSQLMGTQHELHQLPTKYNQLNPSANTMAVGSQDMYGHGTRTEQQMLADSKRNV